MTAPGPDAERVAHALAERVKELRAMHTVAELLRSDALSLDALFVRIADALAIALQWPDVGMARVTVAEASGTGASARWRETPWVISAAFATRDGTAGQVSVGYCEAPRDEVEVFLDEERLLIGWVADAIAAELDRRAAAHTLAESRALLQIASRLGRLGAWTIDVASRRLRWSEEARALHGAPAESEHRVDDLLDAYAPEHQARIRAVVERCAREGEPFDETARMPVRGARHRWVRIIGEAARDDAGRVVRVQGAIQDISNQKAAEDELRKKDELMRVASETARVAGWMIAVPEMHLELPNELMALVGFEPGSTVSLEQGLAMYSAASRERVQAALTRCVQDGVGFDMEVELERAGIPSGFARIQGEAVRDDDGRIRRVRGAFQDITDRRRAEDAVRASEERFRLMARAANVAFWDRDIAGEKIWWSEGFEVLFGHDPSALDPKSHTWAEHVHPDDRARVTAGLNAVIDGGGAEWSDEYRFMHRDGRAIHVLDRAHVVRDASGRAVRMLGGMTDITERRRNEDKLREQATLLDEAQDAILVRDLEHNVLYWNRSAERVYGWRASEVVGRPLPDLLYNDGTEFRAAMATTLARGQWTGELERVTRDGAPLTIEARWTLVYDESGAPRAVFAIESDITTSKRMEQQVLRNQRMESLGTLAGGIAHDLNNVLAPILMTASVLREDETNPARAEDIANIEACAQRGADMVRQLLGFARGTDGKKVEVDLSAIGRDVEQLMRETFPKNIVLELELAGGSWRALADPTQMHQMIVNLCVNARDAMPRGGVLRVAVEQVDLDETYAGMNPEAHAGPHIVVRVEDTGMGMAPDVMERIFDPFFTTKPVGQGTGLGLSTVHAIARGHGGFVHAYSEQGKGSRFRVYLPAKKGEVDEAAVVVSAGPPPGRGELVLVVDDEESIRFVAQRTLERFNYRVLVAAHGAEALAMYARHRSDIAVVLTDMAMPIMDGPATIVALKAMNPAVRIVGSSGLGANGHLAKSMEAGVRHFVPKPYTADVLLAVLRAALDS